MLRHVARSAIARYGIAVLCVTVAVILALWLRPVTLVGGQLSLVAILITGWVCGLRPALVAWVLATLAFAYYFAPPLYSFRVDPPERPGFIIFTLLGLFMATVSAARRKAQGLLESARAQLETRVRERTADLERSNERLRESEEQWRAVFENNPIMYFMVDAAGTVVSVNPFGAEQLGYSVDELVGQSMLKVFYGPDRHAVRAHVALCLEQLGRPSRWELRKVRKDGTVLWVRETAKAMRRAGREPIVLVASEDITEHKEAEEERQERRWMIESMDRVNRAIQDTSDLEQMMSDVLDATLSIFECDRAWLVYPCDPEASSVRHTMHRARPEFSGRFGVGEDLPLHPDSVTAHRIVRAASGPVRFDPESEHALSPEEGKLFGIQSRIVMALYPKGDLPYMFGLSQCTYPRVWTRREEVLFQAIGRRLSDALTSLTMFRRLRESEQRYRSIFESTGVSIWEQDFSGAKAVIDELKAQGVRDFRQYFAAHWDVVRRLDRLVRVLDVNEETVKMFRAKSRADLLASLDKLRTPETRATFVDLLVNIAEGRTSREGEITLQDLEGRQLTALFTITFPPTAKGFERLLITMIDVTQRKHAEQRAAQAHAELAHVTRVTMLGEMTASIAHEVNQPLAAIVADANASLNWLAAAHPDLESVRGALDAIVRDGHRAGEVIQRIRQLATRSAPRKVRLDLNDVVRDVIPLVHAELHGHEVALVLDLAADLPLVLGDRVQLQQVVLNLVMNAIEAMAAVTDRPRELRIGSTRHDADHVAVTIQDTGVGIDRSMLDQLFTAFFTTKPGGMGMGLSISRSIIEAHGGWLSAAANFPHGAIFQFSLAVYPGAAVGGQVPRASGAAP